MDKENVVYIHKGILFCHKELCHKEMDGTGDHADK
jgi:hypothetical protein